MHMKKSMALARTTVTASAATEHLREQIVGGKLQPGETLRNHKSARCLA